MLLPIKVNAVTAYEVRVHLAGYKLTLDDFARTALQFTDLMLAGVKPHATKPSIRDDLINSALPSLTLHAEIHRTSAMCEDAVLNLRAKRLAIESLQAKRPKDVRLDARRPLLNPMVIIPERDQMLSKHTLAFLAKKGQTYPRWRRDPAVPIDLVVDDRPGNKGMSVTLSDLGRWVPVMLAYQLVPPGTENLPAGLTSTEEVHLRGFTRLMAALLEGVCFVLQVNQHLPQESLRQDLLICHHRARKIKAALDDALLKVEASIHLLNAYGDHLANNLMILASRAPALESIYGNLQRVPGLVAPNDSGSAKVEPEVTDDDIAAFHREGA